MLVETKPSPSAYESVFTSNSAGYDKLTLELPSASANEANSGTVIPVNTVRSLPDTGH